MKYSIIKLAIAGIITGSVMTSCNVTSHTETAAGVDFSKYKTFAWANPANSKKSDRSNNDIIDNNIKNSVSEELGKKGWQEADSNPDVLLDYTIAVRHSSKRRDEPVYSRPYTQYFYRRGRVYSVWYPSTLIGYNSQNIPFKEGELSINMVDAKTNKLIWQGWAEGEINSNRVTTEDVTTRVKSIFKKFNYPAKG